MGLTVDLDEARELMYDALLEDLDEDTLDTTIQRAVQKKITELYDNRERLVKQDT